MLSRLGRLLFFYSPLECRRWPTINPQTSPPQQTLQRNKVTGGVAEGGGRGRGVGMADKKKPTGYKTHTHTLHVVAVRTGQTEVNARPIILRALPDPADGWRRRRSAQLPAALSPFRSLTIAAPRTGRTVSGVVAIWTYPGGERPERKRSRQLQRGFEAAADTFSHGGALSRRGLRTRTINSLPGDAQTLWCTHYGRCG